MTVRRPEFVLIGVPRAGTTSLFHYLGQHPSIEVSAIKEVNFLAYPGSADAAARRPWLDFPVTTVEEYDALFDRRDDQIAVDFSISCFQSDVAVDRIRRYTPDARMLVLLRDPVARAWSAHLNRVRKGYETRSAADALVPGERTVDNGFYAARLQRFIDAFGADRVTTWLHDDIRRDTPGALRSIFGDLGVDPDVEIDAGKVYNAASVPRSKVVTRVLPDFAGRRRIKAQLPAPITSAAKRVWRLAQQPAPALPSAVEQRLRALYADDIAETGRLVGRDLSGWTRSTTREEARGA